MADEKDTAKRGRVEPQRAKEANPGTEMRDRFRAANAPVLGGDFARWCRTNAVGPGDGPLFGRVAPGGAA